jgi:hypothetical protein
MNLPIRIMVITVAVLFVVGPLAIATALLTVAPPAARPYGLIPLALGLGIAWLMSRNNSWVELDGDLLREHRLFTGIIVERSIADITRISPLQSAGVGLADMALDAILKTSNRGFVIYFEYGRRISLVRGDAGGIDPLMEALAVRMGPRWHECMRT